MIQNRGYSKESAYARLEADLRHLINEGTLSPDQPIDKEVDLANRYGISRNTARKALQSLVDDGLIVKIKGRGTFVNPSRTSYKRAVGNIPVLFMLPYNNMKLFKNSYDRELVAGAISEVIGTECNILVEYPENVKITQLLQDWKAGRLGGMVWERPEKEYYSLIEELASAGIPQVTISRSVPNVPCIFHDFESLIRKAVDFLFGIGHRKIIMYDILRDYPIFKKRQKVFLDALTIKGVKQPEQYLQLIKPKTNETEFIGKFPPFSAIVIFSYCLDAFYAWAEENGICIPGDIAVLAMGTEQMEEYEHLPGLSVLAESRFAIGQQAVSMISKQMNGEHVSTAPVKVNGKLLINESCVSPSDYKLNV